VLTVAASLTTVSAVRAQGRGSRFSVGTESLRWLLKNAKLDPVSDAGNLPFSPDKTILIVLGDLNWLENKVPGGLTSFVQRGGAVLAASDIGSGSELQELTGVAIRRNFHLEYFPGGNKCNHGQTDRPYVIPGPARLPDGSDNPFNATRVATNIPSYLLFGDSLKHDLVTLARFPSGVAKIDDSSDDKEMAPQADRELPFAVGGSLGEGRILVCADHSLFINEMILDDECENLEFTVRCLDWLKADGRRTRAMLVEDGRVYSNFDVQLKRLPSVPPLKVLQELLARRDEITEDIQHKLAESDSKDVADKSLMRALGGRGEVQKRRLWRYAAWSCGLGLTLFFFYRISNHGRYFGERRLPLLGPAVEAQRPAGTLSELRPRGQIEAGNLWESARELAQISFGQNPGLDGPAPRPEVVGGYLPRRRKIRQRIDRLWRIAYGSDPVPVPPQRWEAFLTDLENFERDLASGAIRLPAE
jgi:hypothetical protein